MTDQLPLFASDGAEALIDDVDGLLFGPGHVVRGGDGSRVSILVDDLWRAEALVSECGARGIAAEYQLSREETDRLVVRTAFDSRLNPLAARWAPGQVARAGSTPPRLSTAALRLWTIAAGQSSDNAFMLGLAPTDEPRWSKSGAALAERGLAAVLVGPRGGGPAYRITSTKRLRRLALLVGDAPDAAPEYAWP